MRAILLTIMCVALLAAAFTPASAELRARPVVLVLVDGLTWTGFESEPRLRELLRNGASANLSTAQGATPRDQRIGYLFLGAGARVDTVALPKELPKDPVRLTGAFAGPASTVQPGALGEALDEAGVKAAAIGQRARLVVMDHTARVPFSYSGTEPAFRLEEALQKGAGFVAVEAASPEKAGELVEAAQRAGATVAVASPNASPGPLNLTPFAVSGPEGLLHSPTTRTAGLISNADVAPTLLSKLGVERPANMQGRAVTVRPGTAEDAKRLGERISFVAEKRHQLWAAVLALILAALLAGGLWKGRAAVRPLLLTLAALPAAALLAGAVPLANVPSVAALIMILAGLLTVLARKLTGTLSGSLAAVFLTASALVAADAAAGGALMQVSALGYNPAYGTRFYGIGNEYAAVLAGSLTMGLGALADRKKPPTTLLAAGGGAAVLVLGLPTMGADVGGSLALGFGLGATIGLLRGKGPRSLVLWAAGGLAFAAALFLASGLLFPDVSHGSRAAGGEGGLYDILVRKLMIGLRILLQPALLALLAALAALTYAGWRRTRGTSLAAGILGASITALVSGAINDSSLVATLFALLYPAAASAIFLLTDARSNPVNRKMVD